MKPNARWIKYFSGIMKFWGEMPWNRNYPRFGFIGPGMSKNTFSVIDTNDFINNKPKTFFKRECLSAGLLIALVNK